MIAFFNVLITLICVLLGIHLVVDAFMQATTNESSGDKFCYKMKYIASLASGLCIIFSPHDLEHLVYAVACALWAWPTTFYKLTGWLYVRFPRVYDWLIAHFPNTNRRRAK